MRPTTKDLAKAAGVSLATVDRVLNDRPGVKEKTVVKVNQAIERIGFVRNIAAANLARRKDYKFLFLLPQTGDQFLTEILYRIDEANAAFASDMVELRAQRIDEIDPHRIANFLRGLTPEHFDGVAIMAPETPQVRDAMVRLRERGIEAIPFLSGQSKVQDRDFVGINNRAAGASAAHLMGRFTRTDTGKILVIAETMQSRDSLERRLGFDETMTADFAGLQVLPSLETYGDPDRTMQVVRNSFENHADIVGVYVLSSEARLPLEAVAAAANVSGRTTIAHERTPFTEAALRSGALDAVIAQNPGHLVRSAIRILRARCDHREPFASQERIRIEILIKENL